MKKIFSGIGAVLCCALIFSSCEQSDCLCKYYNDDDAVIGYDSWDGSEVSATACADMEDDLVVEDVNGNDIVADHVACSTSW